MDVLSSLLQKEIPVLTTQIRALYTELDKRFHLHGADVPITFGMERDSLGSYTQGKHGEQEQFHFSLLFVGYSVKNPLSREDRLDLYKHEYAHYMQYHMPIPAEYQWQHGTHGSAWKYCCSLVGAAPTPYYRAGEALMKHDYEKAIQKPKLHDHTVPLRDNYRREQEYQKQKNSVAQYEAGENVVHPKFGEGTIEHVEKRDGSVHLHIRFGEELKKIDQKWFLKTKYRKKQG